MFLSCCTRLFIYWGVKKFIFLLAGHKVHFIANAGQKNPFFDLQVEKKSCDPIIEKTCFLLVDQKTIHTKKKKQ